MKFRIKDLKNYLKIPDSANASWWKKVAEDLNLKSFETISDGKNLEVDLLPNRFPDSASLIGLAREISTITSSALVLPKISIKETKGEAAKFVKIKVKTPQCLNYFGRVIIGVKNQKSPKWLEEFVEFYGFNSISLIVDLSNFAMIEYGAPVHIFDLDKIEGDFILRESQKGEIFQSLTAKQFELPQAAVVIENKGKIIDLVSIQGGEIAKATLETKNILIQAPIVEPGVIRTISKKIDLKTDASHRFERGIPAANSFAVIERLASLIQETAGGKVISEKLEFGKIPQLAKIILHPHKIQDFSGFNLSIKQVKAILKKIGCKTIKQTNSYVYIEAPFWRLDLKMEEDLIEEIIRIEGWNNIKSELPKTHKFAKEEESLILDNLSKNIMIQAGLSEVLNYSFVSEDEICKFAEIINQADFVRVLNPISKNYSVYRPFIFNNLIKATKNNLNHFREIRIFEIGHCAKLINNKIVENKKLGFLISLPNMEETLLEASGLTRMFFEKLGIETHIKNAHLDAFDSSALIHLHSHCDKDDEVKNYEIRAGFIGLLNKELSKFYDLDQKVVVGEFDLDLILNNLEKERTYEPIPEFPAIVRDISLIIPEMAQIDHLESEIQYLGGDILESTSLFDVYQPKDMSDKRSLSFRLVFRAQDKSLTDNEVNKIMQKIAHSLINRFGASVR